MKAITFRDARGIKKTVKHSPFKIAWRWLVRFITTGLMLFPLIAFGQSFTDVGLKKIDHAGAIAVTSTATAISGIVSVSLTSGSFSNPFWTLSTQSASVIGTDFSVAPTSGVLIGGIDDDGNFAPLSVDRHHGYRQLHVASIDFAADRAGEGYLFGTSRTTTLSAPGGTYNILLIVNLSTSPVNVYPYKFIFDVDVATAQVNYKIYVDPVVTSSGSYLPSTSLFLGDVATSTGSYAQTYTLTSLSSVGTLIEAYASSGAQSLVVDTDFAMVIAPGHKIVVRAASDAATQSTLTFKWAEAP